MGEDHSNITMSAKAIPKINEIKKRLIVCCDGTWFAADKGTVNMPSNVARIGRLISGEGHEIARNAKDEAVRVKIPQIVYYQSGVGAGDLSFVDKRLQGATGSSLDNNVCTAYNFLCNNYHEGDEIFLFGFSRGAYTARALAGLILGAGILPPGEMIMFPEMYAAYKKRGIGADFSKSSWWQQNQDRIHYHGVTIKFVGVWDTVGALGIPDSYLSRLTNWNSEYQFYDTELHPHIEKAAHALALDEYRGPFSPTLWYHKKHNNHGWASHLTQCWFPGFHAHVGGGTITGADEESSVDDICLAWMVDQVGTLLEWNHHELERFVKHCKEQQQPWAEGNLEDSASVAYTMPGMGGWLVRTPGQYNHEKDKDEKKHPNSEKPEYWGTNEFIHPCVRYRMGLMKSQQPKDLGVNKGKLWSTPIKSYQPWALKKFELGTCDSKDDDYWYWRLKDEKKGDVVIREWQISPMWAENSPSIGLERRLVPEAVMKELDEGNNYGAAGPLRAC
ncbi:hypothetical protein TWF696_005800 [Orbilia brochopaga]|uniref:T6SS Phospholipase effector Tle1-like catalytic domain-containing protein n=1 Tax=Orbilia brochopaga TaxID=3140254 RepID=A0AAV9UU74_9PEZI